MSTVMEIKGKTEQRVQNVVSELRRARRPYTYDDLILLTGSTYDSLLYILATLQEVGMVERTETPEGPGRPKVLFRWKSSRRAQALGA